MDDSDDSIGAVDEKGPAIGAKAKKSDQARTNLGAVDNLSCFGLYDVNIAFIGACQDVVAVERKYCRTRGMFPVL